MSWLRPHKGSSGTRVEEDRPQIELLASTPQWVLLEPYSPVPGLGRILGFDPTRVLLEPEQSNVTQELPRRFDPTRVLLELWRTPFSSVRPPGFDPTRVLLEPGNGDHDRTGRCVASTPQRVRLEQSHRTRRAERVRAFDPSQGSSETKGVMRRSASSWGFDPTKVLLERSDRVA